MGISIHFGSLVLRFDHQVLQTAPVVKLFHLEALEVHVKFWNPMSSLELQQFNCCDIFSRCEIRQLPDEALKRCNSKKNKDIEIRKSNTTVSTVTFTFKQISCYMFPNVNENSNFYIRGALLASLFWKKVLKRVLLNYLLMVTQWCSNDPIYYY